MKKRKDFHDLTGEMFGDLKVESLAHMRSRVSHWNCRCICGKLHVTRGHLLTRGFSTRCSSCTKIKNNGHHYIDLTGQRFSRLYVIFVSHYDLRKRTYHWLCRCDCGKEKRICGSTLRNGRTQSCGCLAVVRARERIRQDLIGRKFGRLTVIGLLPTEKGQRIWSCECSCGVTKKVHTAALTTGHTRSCGCLKKDASVEAMRKRRLPPGQAGLNKVFGQYKTKNAERRNLSFLLTKDQFRALTSNDCEYCGAPPSKNEQGYLYNGIDRVDNDKGYTMDNVVPCCTCCNLAKRGMSAEEFLSWVERVHCHQKSQDALDRRAA